MARAQSVDVSSQDLLADARLAHEQQGDVPRGRALGDGQSTLGGGIDREVVAHDLRGRVRLREDRQAGVAHADLVAGSHQGRALDRDAVHARPVLAALVLDLEARVAVPAQDGLQATDARIREQRVAGAAAPDGELVLGGDGEELAFPGAHDREKRLAQRWRLQHGPVDGGLFPRSVRHDALMVVQEGVHVSLSIRRGVVLESGTSA